MKIKLTILFILLFTTSCLTKYVWGDKVYEEVMNQFLVGEDGRYVVMIGKDYHYVFTDESRIFYRILTLKQTGILTVNPKKSYLKLSNNNDVDGYVTLEGPFSVLPVEDIGFLSSMGYKPNSNDFLSIKVDLHGRRYLQRYLGPNVIRSNNTFTLPIYYDDSTTAQNIGKAAITPITVGLDAVLLIGKMVVYPLH